MKLFSHVRSATQRLPHKVIAATSLFLLPFAVIAAHDVSLPGSTFEIDSDANLTVEHSAPSLDWATVLEIRQDDAPSGKTDNSFTQGAKEDTQVPAISFGSIPPNKSDLKVFGLYEETEEDTGTDDEFVHVYWTRVQDPKGTTNMDFEFSQGTTTSGNGVTILRTAGDLLIEYKLSKGGKFPQLFRYTWLDGSEGFSCEASKKFPCWGYKTDLTSAGDAAGSINSSSIAASDADGLGSLDPRTFGEASVLKAAFGNGQDDCFAFGFAAVKSRSADSFTSALKDFIAPVPVDIRNCGKVTIYKKFQTDTELEGAEFTLFEDNDVVGIFDDADVDTEKTCTTEIVQGAAQCSIGDLLPGFYCIVETKFPPIVSPRPTSECFTIIGDENVEFTINNRGDG